jgi:hypothetical protein
MFRMSIKDAQCTIYICENGYGCMDIGCTYKHPINYNYIDTYDQFIKTKKIPCKFGTYCIKYNCNETKSHPDTWDINEVCLIQSMHYKYKSYYASIENDIDKSDKFYRKYLTYYMLSIKNKENNNNNISYQEVYNELFGIYNSLII